MPAGGISDGTARPDPLPYQLLERRPTTVTALKQGGERRGQADLAKGPEGRRLAAARGAGGETLLALAEILSADPSAWDQRLRRKGEQLVVLFPDGFAGLSTTSQASLDALAQNGLLDVNPLTPLRRVTEIDGKHGALLTLDVSRQLLALTPLQGLQRARGVDDRAAADPAPLGGADPEEGHCQLLTPTSPKCPARRHPPRPRVGRTDRGLR